MSEVTKEIEVYIGFVLKGALIVLTLRGLTLILGDTHHMPVVDEIFFWLVRQISEILKSIQYLWAAK